MTIVGAGGETPEHGQGFAGDCCRRSTTGNTPTVFQKRRVKPASQKYSDFQNTEIMI
jgi:hypothetical protein